MSERRHALPVVLDRAPLVERSMLQSALAVPAMVANAGNRAAKRFLDFFAASIENDNTRMAYHRAVCSFFAWLEEHGYRRARRYRAVPHRRLPEGAAGIGSRRSHRQGAHGGEADRQAAPGRDPHAVRLARRRPGSCDQPGACGARAQARRQARQDAGLERGPGPPAARQHQGHQDHQGRGRIRPGGAVARRAARPRADRRHGLQLCADQRRRRDGGRGLFCKRQALVAAAARERRQAPRDAGAPQARSSFSTSISTPPASASTARPPSSARPSAGPES